MLDVENKKFLRQFSMTMRKEKGFLLAKMSFEKDFISTKRGDLYPTLEQNGEFLERVQGGKYDFCAKSADASTVRLVCRYFPYATYELKTSVLNGACGFVFRTPCAKAQILFAKDENGVLCVTDGTSSVCSGLPFVADMPLLVTVRGQFFDVYADVDGYKKHIATFQNDEFSTVMQQAQHTRALVGLCVQGTITVSGAQAYMDTGISQADIRPVRYENGDVMMENGKIYLTTSVRMEQGGYQGVFSWTPGTAQFDLTGALFFDVGDGLWGNDVASSILYHRHSKKWLLWVCSFTHGHVLAHAEFDGDPRFGLNVLDVQLMPRKDGAKDTDFFAKEGDEDPDFVFDETRGVWRMALCRLSSETKEYRYFYFESERPFDGYRYVSSGKIGAETGGSIVRDGGRYLFICGNSFSLRANYRAYVLPDMENFCCLSCDYDDGGFRGWGTVIPVCQGTRKKYYWLTFDRHGGSDYNWSYGNVYCFCLEE